MFIWSLLILIFIFLQATVLSIDVVSVLVLWALLVWPVRRAWVIVFVVGLVSDVIYGRWLGVSSIWYLVSGFGLWLYGRRNNPFHPLFLGLFVFGVVSVSSRLLMNYWAWPWALVVSIGAVLARHWLVEWQWGGRLRISN